MNKGVILSIDDDAGLQTVLKHYLEGENYRVITANNGAEAIEQISTNTATMILLDLVLPDTDGVSLIPQIRAKTKAPILVLSGKSDTTEKIICLEMGADDYMTKPFEMRELATRLKVILRRLNGINDSANDLTQNSNDIKEDTKFGDFTLNHNQVQLFDKNNQSLEITSGEFELLEALVKAPNRALSREQLFELTRDGEYDVYDRAIDIQIGRIRKKLGDEGTNIIRTVRGIGYMFCPPTESS